MTERDGADRWVCQAPDPKLWDPPTKDTGLRSWGTCAGCGIEGRLLKDDVAEWCEACGGAGPE